MNVSIRDQVRQRANFACEFCGISEIDAGGQLTIDHYQPKGKGGDDGFYNLVCCCARCNQYKLDYWPTISEFGETNRTIVDPANCADGRTTTTLTRATEIITTSSQHRIKPQFPLWTTP